MENKITAKYLELLDESTLGVAAILAAIGVFSLLPYALQQAELAKACIGEEGIEKDICKVKYEKSKIEEDMMKLENKISKLKTRKNKLDIQLQKLLREKQMTTGKSSFRKKQD